MHMGLGTFMRAFVVIGYLNFSELVHPAYSLTVVYMWVMAKKKSNHEKTREVSEKDKSKTQYFYWIFSCLQYFVFS